MLLVVLGHILQYANPQYSILPYTLAQSFISSFHMPAFFLLSGMLSDPEAWRKRSLGALLKGRCRTLLIPYVFFELLAVLWKRFVLHSISLTAGLYRLLTFRCNVGADWYLPALLLASLLYWLAVRCKGKYTGVLLALLGLALPCLLPDGHGWNLLFRGLLGFGFMELGALLKTQLMQCSVWKCIAAFLLTAASAALALKWNLTNDFYSCALRCPPLFLISGVCGLYFILGLACLLDCRVLVRIGENTLAIMGTHQLVLYTVSGSSSPLWVLGMLALIAAVELVLVWPLDRFCPELIGKKRKEPAHG